MDVSAGVARAEQNLIDSAIRALVWQGRRIDRPGYLIGALIYLAGETPKDKSLERPGATTPVSAAIVVLSPLLRTPGTLRGSVCHRLVLLTAALDSD